MSDENPIEAIRARAAGINFEDDEERDDWIEARMRRAGYKKGPGDWISIDDDDDDEERDDDNEPVTRADIRRMEKARKRQAAVPPPPPKKEPTGDGNPPKKTSKSRGAWWD